MFSDVQQNSLCSLSITYSYRCRQVYWFLFTLSCYMLYQSEHFFGYYICFAKEVEIPGENNRNIWILSANYIWSQEHIPEVWSLCVTVICCLSFLFRKKHFVRFTLRHLYICVRVSWKLVLSRIWIMWYDINVFALCDMECVTCLQYCLLIM